MKEKNKLKILKKPTELFCQPNRFEPKTLFSIFFKSNSPVPIHAVDKDKTVDHNYYIENCLKAVVKEIQKQRKSSSSTGIKLLQDNARAHNDSDAINR